MWRSVDSPECECMQHFESAKHGEMRVAMDYSDVLVHVFLPEAREFYNLEHLWADAKLTQIPDLD